MARAATPTSAGSKSTANLFRAAPGPGNRIERAHAGIPILRQSRNDLAGPVPCMKKLITMFLLMAIDSGCRSTAYLDSGPGPGIPLAMATTRAQTIEDVRYDLSFGIPNTVSEPVPGREIIHFKLKNVSGSVVLDF